MRVRQEGEARATVSVTGARARVSGPRRPRPARPQDRRKAGKRGEAFASGWIDLPDGGVAVHRPQYVLREPEQVVQSLACEDGEDERFLAF